MKMAFTIFDDNANGKPMAPATNTGSSHTLDTNTCCKPSSTFFGVNFFEPEPSCSGICDASDTPNPFSFHETHGQTPAVSTEKTRTRTVRNIPTQALPCSGHKGPGKRPSQPHRLPCTLRTTTSITTRIDTGNHHNPTHILHIFPRKNSLDFSEYSLYGHAKRI